MVVSGPFVLLSSLVFRKISSREVDLLFPQNQTSNYTHTHCIVDIVDCRSINVIIYLSKSFLLHCLVCGVSQGSEGSCKMLGKWASKIFSSWANIFGEMLWHHPSPLLSSQPDKFTKLIITCSLARSLRPASSHLTESEPSLAV